MAFFSRARAGEEFETASDPAAPAEAKPGPNPIAEKALGMFGISIRDLEQKGAEIRSMLDDYRERMNRIELKLDLALSDLAELINRLPPK